MKWDRELRKLLMLWLWLTRREKAAGGAVAAEREVGEVCRCYASGSKVCTCLIGGRGRRARLGSLCQQAEAGETPRRR